MLGVSRASAGEMLKRLEKEGLIRRGEHKEALLTAAGRKRAEKVVRKHRIVERLLTDFMGYTAAEAHVYADDIGETFSDDMVERMEEKLGNPDRCPHGWPVDPAFEQAENAELAPLAALEAPAQGDDRAARRARRRPPALVLRRRLRPGDEDRAPRRTAGGGPVHRVAVDGEEQAIGEKAAAGLFVKPSSSRRCSRRSRRSSSGCSGSCRRPRSRATCRRP